jgi:alpha-N-arabinofuranosidase
MLIQSIFYPFEMFSRRREGVSLRPVMDGPTYEGKTNGQVYYVDTSAILNGNKLHVFATNRSLEEPTRVRVKLVDRAVVALDSGELLIGPDPKAANSLDQPDVIRSRSFAEANVGVKIAKGEVSVELPPLSVAAMTFAIG